jgi:hypothetical protein
MNREEILAHKLAAVLVFAQEGRLLSLDLGDTFEDCTITRNGPFVTAVLRNGLTIQFRVVAVTHEDVPR